MARELRGTVLRPRVRPVVTQLSALLVDDLTISGATETLFLLLVAWWAWIYTTWATNWFDPGPRPGGAALSCS